MLNTLPMDGALMESGTFRGRRGSETGLDMDGAGLITSMGGTSTCGISASTAGDGWLMVGVERGAACDCSPRDVATSSIADETGIGEIDGTPSPLSSAGRSTLSGSSSGVAGRPSLLSSVGAAITSSAGGVRRLTGSLGWSTAGG